MGVIKYIKIIVPLCICWLYCMNCLLMHGHELH